MKTFGFQTPSAISRLLIFLCFILPLFSSAQDTASKSFTPHGKIWGYMFGDGFYKVGGDTLYFGKSEYAEVEKGVMGGKLRRIFFGYDYAITQRWSSRLLLEATNLTTTPEGDFGMVVQLGYLEYKDFLKFIPHATFRAGLIPTPVYAFPEESWGYRSVEKDALELRGYGNQVDQGASFEGSFNKENTGGFYVMMGNGSGDKPIAGKYLEYYISVHQKFFDDHLNIEIMADHKRLDEHLRRTLLRSFISYESHKMRFGIEISPNYIQEMVKVHSEEHKTTTRPLLTSVFLAPNLTKNISMFLRWDHVSPDLDYHRNYEYAEESQNYEEDLFIGGLQFKANDKINIMPNIYMNMYTRKKDEVVNRKTDLVLRTTLYFIF